MEEKNRKEHLCTRMCAREDRASLCNSPGSPRTHFIDKAGLELTKICLPLFSEC